MYSHSPGVQFSSHSEFQTHTNNKKKSTLHHQEKSSANTKKLLHKNKKRRSIISPPLITTVADEIELVPSFLCKPQENNLFLQNQPYLASNSLNELSKGDRNWRNEAFSLLPAKILAEGGHSPLSMCPQPSHSSPPFLSMEENSSGSCPGFSSTVLSQFDNESEEKYCGLKYWLNKARHETQNDGKSKMNLDKNNEEEEEEEVFAGVSNVIMTNSFNSEKPSSSCSSSHSTPLKPPITNATTTTASSSFSTPTTCSAYKANKSKSKRKSAAVLNPPNNHEKKKKKQEIVNKIDFNRNSGVQIDLFSYGDLQETIDNLVYSIRTRWRTLLSNINLDEKRKSMDFIQEELKKPVNRRLIKNYSVLCMQSVLTSVQYALGYRLQISDQQVPSVYAKYENFLKDVGKEFDWNLRLISKSQPDPRIEALRHIGVLAIIASRACLCRELLCAWNADIEGLSSSHCIASVSCKKVDGGSSAPLLSGCGGATFPSLNPLDNPASNASHETHQESPASTISYFSSGGSTAQYITNSISQQHHGTTSHFTLLTGVLPTLRVKEYGVRSTEIWDFYEEKRKSLLMLSSSSSTTSDSHPHHHLVNNPIVVAARKFDKILQNEFPWGLDIVSSRFQDDSFFVLSFLDCIVATFDTFLKDEAF